MFLLCKFAAHIPFANASNAAVFLSWS